MPIIPPPRLSEEGIRKHPAGLSGVTPDALRAWLVERGEKPFRARQILDAVWHAEAASTAAVTTLPPALRSALDEAFRWDTMGSTELTVADGGRTEKALHHLADDTTIESVLMHFPAGPGHRERHTLCISSEAGCAVGCPFCATGELGFSRDLLTAEILDQVRWASRHLAADGL
ncbi:MAG TPA: hypothetical protein VNH13_00750, partial [Candidatus Acidoferrales bacterium]|nr:hypothetical protein [Candidatus Acidoferrales bacterium]